MIPNRNLHQTPSKKSLTIPNHNLFPSLNQIAPFPTTQPPTTLFPTTSNLGSLTLFSSPEISGVAAATSVMGEVHDNGVLSFLGACNNVMLHEASLGKVMETHGLTTRSPLPTTAPATSEIGHDQIQSESMIMVEMARTLGDSPNTGMVTMESELKLRDISPGPCGCTSLKDTLLVKGRDSDALHGKVSSCPHAFPFPKGRPSDIAMVPAECPTSNLVPTLADDMVNPKTPDSCNLTKKDTNLGTYSQVVKGKVVPPLCPMKLQYHPPISDGGRKVVSPPPEVAVEGCKRWQNCLVGYMIEKKLPYSVVNGIAHRVWGSKGLLEVLANDNGFFFFQFSNAEKCSTILEAGPWLFSGKPLFLKRWQPGLILTKESHSKIPVWAKFYNIPHEFWTEDGLSYIASAVGRPLYADSLTESHKRISFARVCVEIDAGAELVDSFDLTLNGGFPGVSPSTIEIRVDYQWKPKICVLCKSFGHKTGTCKSDYKPMVWLKKNDGNVAPSVATSEGGNHKTKRVSNVVVSETKAWSHIVNPVELVASVQNFKGDKPTDDLLVQQEPPPTPMHKITSPNPFQALIVEGDTDSDVEPSTASPDKSLWPSKLLGKNIDGAPIVAGNSSRKKKKKKQKNNSVKKGNNSPGASSNPSHSS